MNSIVTFEREDVGENGVGRRRCDGDKDDDDDEDVVVVHVVIVVVTLGRDLRLSSCLRVCLRETRREDVKENGVGDEDGGGSKEQRTVEIKRRI